jgi:hypothetical protein
VAVATGLAVCLQTTLTYIWCGARLMAGPASLVYAKAIVSSKRDWAGWVLRERFFEDFLG